MLPSLRSAVDALNSVLPATVSYYLVDDGSRDGTLAELLSWSADNERVSVISLSRNFGHQAAITAGLDHVRDDEEFVVIMDGDLQDPPELILEMLSKAQEGFDVVYARRRTRGKETLWKRITAQLFYPVMRRLTKIQIPENVGDFRLISKRALDAFREMPEHHRFLRGMFAWIGFPQAEVIFDRQERTAGETKYPTRKMMSLAWNAMTSFSSTPLRLGLVPGLLSILMGMGYCLYSLIRHFSGETVPGWTALVFLISMFGASILIAVWITGEYVAKIFEEVKRRPHYLVKSTSNLEDHDEGR